MGSVPAPDSSGPKRRMFPDETTIDDLKSFMAPFASRLGYKFNTETEFVDEVLQSELEILERDGDIYCPCRIRTGDPKEDVKIVCPCIPFYREQFARIQKCWCGLFILDEVEDGAELLGVINESEGPVEVPVFAEEDLPLGQIRHIKIDKRDIAVAHTQTGYHALSNLCRHAFGPLGEGFLEGDIAICPWHGWRYDVTTGSTDHPNADVKTYETTVRNGWVFVKV